MFSLTSRVFTQIFESSWNDFVLSFYIVDCQFSFFSHLSCHFLRETFTELKIGQFLTCRLSLISSRALCVCVSNFWVKPSCVQGLFLALCSGIIIFGNYTGWKGVSVFKVLPTVLSLCHFLNYLCISSNKQSIQTSLFFYINTKTHWKWRSMKKGLLYQSLKKTVGNIRKPSWRWPVGYNSNIFYRTPGSFFTPINVFVCLGTTPHCAHCLLLALCSHLTSEVWGDCMGGGRLNPSQPYVRQVPYPLLLSFHSQFWLLLLIYHSFILT